MKGYDRVTVVKFRVNYGGGNGAGCFEVKVWADTAKITDVIVTRLRKCSDLIREGKVFIENKTKVVSGVGCRRRRRCRKKTGTGDSLFPNSITQNIIFVLKFMKPEAEVKLQ